MKKRWLSLFGLGNIMPFAAGTFATLISAIILYLVKYILGWYLYTLSFIVILPYIMKLCNDVHSEDGDANYIVIDEAMGVAVFFIFAGKLAIFKVILGMLFFRALDIFKPWPVSYWDNEKSGIGVVADDLIAGILAALIVGFL